MKENTSKKVFISTTPFGSVSARPLELLKDKGFQIELNPFGRKMTSAEVAAHINNADYFIAGTETITEEILNAAPDLKLISRVGVGLDNVPFEETKKRGIRVAYTPNAPTKAVAELVVGLIMSLARGIHTVNADMHNGKWNKHMGSLLSGKTVGVVGVGRIGREIIKLLAPFGVKLLGNDLRPNEAFFEKNAVRSVSKEEIFTLSDFLSLNLSSSPETGYLINAQNLNLMKPTACIINTARGPLVNEKDLCQALINKKISGAALDVFDKEPYDGPLTKLPNVLLTSHIGAATRESRVAMELEAVQAVIEFDETGSVGNEAFNQYA